MRVALSFFLLQIGFFVGCAKVSGLEEVLRKSSTSDEELLRLLDDQAKQLFDKDLGEGGLAEKLVRFYSFEPEDVIQSPASTLEQAVKQGEAYINSNAEQGFKDMKAFVVPIRKMIAGGFFSETKNLNFNKPEDQVEVQQVNSDVLIQKVTQKVTKSKEASKLIKEDLSKFIKEKKPIYAKNCDIWGGITKHYIFEHELEGMLDEKLSYLYWAVADGQFPDMNAAVQRALNVAKLFHEGEKLNSALKTLFDFYNDDLADGSVTKEGNTFIKEFLKAYWKWALIDHPDQAKKLFYESTKHVILSFLATANEKFPKADGRKSYKVSPYLYQFLLKKWKDENWSFGTKGQTPEEDKMASIFKIDFLIHSLRYKPDFDNTFLADLQENVDFLISGDVDLIHKGANSLVVLDIDYTLEGKMYEFVQNLYSTYLHFQVGNDNFKKIADDFDSYLDSHNDQVIPGHKFPVDSKWYLINKFANSIYLEKESLGFKSISSDHTKQVGEMTKQHGNQSLINFINKVTRLHLNIGSQQTAVDFTQLEENPIPKSLINTHSFTQRHIVL